MSLFIDEVVLHFIAGKGGDGLVAWRREKYIPKWGPAGGNGGRGGDIILRATENLNTLSDFRHKKVIRSNEWSKGDIKGMAGRDADTLVIPVPVGTLVTDVETGAIIADLDHVDMQFLLCHGGRGGYGNAHFATSTRQSPNFAELGDIGEERKVKLELKLVADIGIIGMPNAGKSTFIASVTNVRPKIADYPFTTLIPNLGVMDHKGKSLILEDVPGLIVGASEGKGLGIEFLKHIERTHVLLHLLDMFEGDAIIERYRDIRKELKKFSSDLAKKQEIIVLTKLDVVGEEEAKRLLKLFKSKVRGKKIFIVSSAARMGLEELQNALINLDPTEISEELPDEDQEEFHTYDLKESNDANYIKLEKIDGVHFRVSGPRIEQIVRMTSMQNIEWVERVYDILEKKHILSKIRSQLEKDGYAGLDAYFFVGKSGQSKEPTLPSIEIAGRIFPLDRAIFRKKA